jgi:hypothetical protein
MLIAWQVCSDAAALDGFCLLAGFRADLIGVVDLY